MSVYLPNANSKTYIYKFTVAGQSYKGSTHQTTKHEAELVEAKKKLEVRAQAGGLVSAAPIETPTWSTWAEIALAYQAQFITRPELLERTLHMVLAFWGARPARTRGTAAVARPDPGTRPYHNLRLGDPIADPAWLVRFDAWMDARRLSGSTRNSYLSACSDLYACALQPKFRATTGIATNPFVGIRRFPTRTRIVALTTAQILTLVDEASRNAEGRHIPLALCIAALAPKLRLASILSLAWAVHLDPAVTRITVGDHKTVGASGLAQVVPVCAQLREILRDVRTQQLADAERHNTAPTPFVISYYGFGHARTQAASPVRSVRTGLRRAVEAIGLTWGLAGSGVTFHALRHSVATILANPHLVGALTERLRADVMGHKELRTTQQYTHLAASVQEGPHESLSAVLPALRATLAQPPRGRKKTWGGLRPPVRPIGFSRDKKPQQKRLLAFAGSTAPKAQNR